MHVLLPAVPRRRGRRAVSAVLALAMVLMGLLAANAYAVGDTPDDAFRQPMNTRFTWPDNNTFGDTGDQNWNCAGAYPAHSIYTRFTGTGGTVKLRTAGSDFSTVLIVFKANGNALGAAVSCDDGRNSDGSPGQASLDVATTAGQEYIVEAGGCATDDAQPDTHACTYGVGIVITDHGVLKMSILANDDPGNAETLAAGTPVSRTNYGATTSSADTVKSCENKTYDSTVWFAIDAPAKGTASVEVTGDDLYLTVFKDGNVVTCRTGGVVGTIGARADFNVPAGGRYLVQVGSPTTNPSYTNAFTLSYNFVADPDRDGDKDPNDSDCQPDNPAVGHTRDEIPNNDVDEDCVNGLGFNRDGDKEWAAPYGADCDDNDPARFHGNPDLPGDGIDQDCVGGPAAKSLPKAHAGWVGGGAISGGGVKPYFAAKAIQLTDLTRGAKVTVRVCGHGCRTTRFTARSAGKRVYFDRRHRQVLLTGATIEVKVYRPGAVDIIGSYLRIKVSATKARSCGQNLRAGSSRVSGRTCRPR
jgi:hypothetical protein